MWGTSARVNKLTNFFQVHFENASLVGIEPNAMGPTKRNNRVGDEGISKRLYTFTLS